MGEVIHHNFGRAKHFRRPQIATLDHFQDCVIGLGRVKTLRESFMAVRVERLADDILTFDAVLAKQLLQLLQCHLHALMKLDRIPRCSRGHGPLKVINDRQQLDDERFLLRDRSGLAFQPAAPLEILKVGG
jgi:hypothetical protein